MKWIDKRQLKLFILVVLPLAIASLGMMWSTSRMLNGISVTVDQQEASRAWQAVRAAVASSEQRLAGTVTDNAHWDDAASHVYGPSDNEWLAGTWGYPTTDINYDTMYIVDAEGMSISSYHKGALSTVPASGYFGDALSRVLSSLPTDTTTFTAVSSLVNTRDGLALMAAAPILPTSPELKLPTGKPRYLIFARSLSADILAAMGKQYTVDGLEIVPILSARNSDLQLSDHWGRPVAGVTWTAQHPGDAARQSYNFSALAAVLGLIAAMLPISIVHGRTIAKLERKEKEARLAARSDCLSGLPNRLLLLEELTEQLSTSRPDNVALIFVDLDGFKAVNDVYDHQTGDKLIRAVAAGLSALVAETGIVARLGGDEFAILTTGSDVSIKSVALAEKILAFVKEPFDIDGRIASIGASIGIAQGGSTPLQPSDLMRQADIAMYDAKNSGRNCWRQFDSALDLERMEDVSIANELRAFILRGVFEVAYQPMVDSRSHEIIGVEALARWPSTSNRRLDPVRFISIAEEHGLIDGLGSLVLEIACRDIAQWQNLRLAVNLSPLQVNNADLIPSIKRIAAKYGLSLSRLEVEITETVLIRNPKRAKQVVVELQSLGITVALDDFGTGYASVGYLRDYGFDKIKLDRSLTQTMARDLTTQQVVQGTILIAKGLCADIIAEGVETAEQAQLMRLAGCGQLQGYYFGRPGAAADVRSLLRADKIEPTSRRA